jgi:hypothetical protein
VFQMAVLERDCSWRETEVTSTFMRSSMFIRVKSLEAVCGRAKGREESMVRSERRVEVGRGCAAEGQLA